MSGGTAKHDVFQAVADSTRREIVQLLSDEEMPITAIARHFTISRTAVNKHLHILTDAGLLVRQKAGREMRYSFRPEPLFEMRKWLSTFEHYWDERLAALREYVEDDAE